MFAAYQGGPLVEVFTPQVRSRRVTPSLRRRARLVCNASAVSDWEKYPTGAPEKVGTRDGGRGERLRALWKVQASLCGF